MIYIINIALELNDSNKRIADCLHIFTALVMCGDPGSIYYLFGRRFVEGTTEGSTVTYSCKNHFVLMGDPVRTCMADGRWSGSLPTCSRESRRLPGSLSVCSVCVGILNDNSKAGTCKTIRNRAITIPSHSCSVKFELHTSSRAWFRCSVCTLTWKELWKQLSWLGQITRSIMESVALKLWLHIVYFVFPNLHYLLQN